MDPKAALAQLTEISSDVEAAVIFSPEGSPLASTLDDERAQRVAEDAARLLSAADETEDGGPVTQVQAATREGNVFLVREGDTAIVATTPPAASIGLVMYDLRTCLGSLASAKEDA